MNDLDLKRLTAQQILIYKKLKEVESVVKGNSKIMDTLITISEFEREVDKIMERL